MSCRSALHSRVFWRRRYGTIGFGWYVRSILRSHSGCSFTSKPGLFPYPLPAALIFSPTRLANSSSGSVDVLGEVFSLSFEDAVESITGSSIILRLQVFYRYAAQRPSVIDGYIEANAAVVSVFETAP